MNAPKSPSTMNTQIYEEASDWIVRHREDELDERARQAFDAWLRISPEHVRAYLEMSSLWEDVGALSSAASADTQQLIASARAEDNVVALRNEAVSQSASVSAGDYQPPASRRRAPFAIAAALILAVAAGLLTWSYFHRTPLYVTQVGEQRSIALADGSMLELNVRSRVRIRFSEQQRDVDLLEGQALFRVAKDVARPFIVHSGDTQIRAVGTQFDVYRKASGTTVTVIEGRVAVTRAANTAPAPLSAGEQVIVTATAAPEPSRANVAAAVAWTQRRLIFDDTPLSQVVEEFNRYNTRPLVLGDSQLAMLHVSGVFSSADPTLLLRFLREQPGIDVQEAEAEIRIVAR